MDPHPVAIFMAHSRFNIVVLGFLVKTGLQISLRGFQIIGMSKVKPRLNANGVQLVQRVANDLGPTFIECCFAGLHIPLPSADASPLNNVTKALLLTIQRRFAIALSCLIK